MTASQIDYAVKKGVNHRTQYSILTDREMQQLADWCINSARNIYQPCKARSEPWLDRSTGEVDRWSTGGRQVVDRCVDRLTRSRQEVDKVDRKVDSHHAPHMSTCQPCRSTGRQVVDRWSTGVDRSRQVVDRSRQVVDRWLTGGWQVVVDKWWTGGG